VTPLMGLAESELVRLQHAEALLTATVQKQLRAWMALRTHLFSNNVLSDGRP
jgi:hypothetical protein